MAANKVLVSFEAAEENPAAFSGMAIAMPQQ